MCKILIVGTRNMEEERMEPSWEAPPPQRIGDVDEWPLPNGQTVHGVYIAHWSSRRRPIWSRSLDRWIETDAAHEHVGPVVPPGGRCTACRWFEMSLWRDTYDEAYVLVRHNITVVPDESSRVAVARVDHPLDLVQLPGLGPNHKPLRQLLMKAAPRDARIAELGV